MAPARRIVRFDWLTADGYFAGRGTGSCPTTTARGNSLKGLLRAGFDDHMLQLHSANVLYTTLAIQRSRSLLGEAATSAWQTGLTKRSSHVCCPVRVPAPTQYVVCSASR